MKFSMDSFLFVLLFEKWNTCFQETGGDPESGVFLSGSLWRLLCGDRGALDVSRQSRTPAASEWQRAQDPARQTPLLLPLASTGEHACPTPLVFSLSSPASFLSEGIPVLCLIIPYLLSLRWSWSWI